MPSSTISVYYPDGTPVASTRVVLGFSSGMTQPAYTDARGTVTIDHASTGQAKVYVSGKECGSFHSPGRATFTYR